MGKPIRINDRLIGLDHPCYIIAEMSANHNKDYQKAKNLIKIAKECRVNAVKIQTYTPDTLTIDCHNEYFRIESGPWKGQTLYELYEKAYMPWEWQADLKKYADSIGITLFSTPYDESAVDFLEKLNISAYKIASFEIIDIPLIKYIASKGKPVIISTGMASQEEISLAVKTAEEQGNHDIVLLKCTSAYPASPEEMNLVNIKSLADSFNAIPGLSDHSLDPLVPVIAVAMGAKVIEKHFIQSRSEDGPDVRFSLEPQELEKLVKDVRMAESAIGRTGFRLAQKEKENIIFRRSLFVVEDVPEGAVFTSRNIRSIRPGHGMPPVHLNEVIGKKAKRVVKKGTPLQWDLIQDAGK